nr:MAG TPA: hypothetical protein [Caudoviricetes sp.]DAV75254.1 MAG TPA: hypothetical protein [Caudoviricetes sp.]
MLWFSKLVCYCSHNIFSFKFTIFCGNFAENAAILRQFYTLLVVLRAYLWNFKIF